jgi:hypothetical protein
MNTLACLIHVGMKRLTPDQDSGLGIEAEYQEACGCRACRPEQCTGCIVLGLTGRPLRSLAAPALLWRQTGCCGLQQRPLIWSPS